MRVKDCMCKKVVQATSDTTLDKIAKLMQENDVGCVVTHKGRVQIQDIHTLLSILFKGIE